MKIIFIANLTALALLLTIPECRAVGTDARELRAAFESSQRAEGSRLKDHVLIGRDGARFSLLDYLSAGGKPTILSFIYTSCPEVCPTITADLKRIAAQVEARYGARLNVLTVGFDTEADTPAAMREYGERFAADPNVFRFAAADEKTVTALAVEAGFYFKRNPDRSFDHIDMVSVIKPDGTVYKQVYGVRARPEAVAERLAELIEGRPYSPGPVSVIEKLRYFCYRYDPVKGRYVLDYPVITSLAIQALVIGSVIYFVWGGRKRRARGNHQPGGPV